MDPKSPNYTSECDFDVPHQIIEYDPWDLPFSQEDCIDTLLPRMNDYKEKLAKFQGKEPRSIQILKKEDKGNKERDKAIKYVVNT
jgi:hypothetical protein